ncbi:MAG: hypothetical protein WAM86_04495 [Candidatus Sulfotelmatobacter sp.]|jgi:hypothetical protein
MEKLTATQLLAKIKQTAEDAAAFKAYWQDSFPNDLPLPPEYEIKNAIRRLPLDYLAKGIEAYASKLGKSESHSTPNSKSALNYVCAAAWKMMEQDNPDQKFHPTARRQRNAERDPDSQHWNGEAFGNASPEERQRIMAETIARQKSAKGVQ